MLRRLQWNFDAYVHVICLATAFFASIKECRLPSKSRQTIHAYNSPQSIDKCYQSNNPATSNRDGTSGCARVKLFVVLGIDGKGQREKSRDRLGN